MLEERNWAEFREAGLLWWVNRGLHLFGWALVAEMDAGSVARVYPARTAFRGFTVDVEDEGFRSLTKHLRDNADALLSQCQENDSK